MSSKQYKCRVCGSTDVHPVKVVHGNALMKCDFCLTTDDARLFVAVEPPAQAIAPPDEGERVTALSSGEAMREYYPPDDVQNAARVVHNYFASRGAKSWAFGELQSRNWTPPLSLTASKEDVLRLAGAFGCQVVPSKMVFDLAALYENIDVPENVGIPLSRSDVARELAKILAHVQNPKVD